MHRNVLIIFVFLGVLFNTSLFASNNKQEKVNEILKTHSSVVSELVKCTPKIVNGYEREKIYIDEDRVS